MRTCCITAACGAPLPEVHGRALGRAWGARCARAHGRTGHALPACLGAKQITCRRTLRCRRLAGSDKEVKGGVLWRVQKLRGRSGRSWDQSQTTPENRRRYVTRCHGIPGYPWCMVLSCAAPRCTSLLHAILNAMSLASLNRCPIRSGLSLTTHF